MEIVLQWLDELDDAVFALVLAWEQVRRRCVRIGAAAAAGLAGCSAGAAADWTPLLGGIAAASIGAALAGGAFAALAEALTSRSRRV